MAVDNVDNYIIHETLFY